MPIRDRQEQLAMRCYITLVAALGAFAVGIAAVRAGEVPEQYKPAIKKGLAWLVKQQKADGSWAAMGEDHVGAFTAFAGLALLMDGGSPSKGLYAENIRRAADWCVQNCQKGSHDGLLAGAAEGPTKGYMFSHGYGMLFLASVYASEEDRTAAKGFKERLQRVRRKEYRETLQRAVEFAVKAQSSTGGWHYVASTEVNGADEPTATLCQIQGIRAVQLAGIDVPKATLDKARAYLAKITSQRGGLCYGSGSTSERPGLTAAALACALQPGDYGGDLGKKWLKYSEQTILGGGRLLGGQAGYQVYHLLHSAQVMHGLGETRYAELFGKGNEIKWSTYRKRCFGQLAGSQQADGSWSIAAFGPAFATAVHLIALQLDGDAVPVFSTKKRR
jgi:hypothetical protein